MSKIFIYFIFIFFLFIIAFPAGAAKFTDSWPFVGKATTPQEFIAALFKLGLMIGGLLAFGAIVYAGIIYVFSVGNSSKQADARDRIYMALLGLLILGLSWLILSTISGEFVIFPAKLEPEGFVYVPPVPIVGGWRCSNGQCNPHSQGNFSTELICKAACSTSCRQWHEGCNETPQGQCCSSPYKYKCVAAPAGGNTKWCNGDYKWSCEKRECKVALVGSGGFDNPEDCVEWCKKNSCGIDKKGTCYYGIKIPFISLCPTGWTDYEPQDCPSILLKDEACCIRK